MTDKIKKITTKETERTTIIEESMLNGTCPDIIETDIENIENENIENNEKDKIQITKQLDLEGKIKLTNCSDNKNSISKTCDDIRDFFCKNYYVKDIDMIDVPLAVAITHMFPGDPVWLGIVGQSSGWKSELIRSFGDEVNIYIYPVSRLTANAVISGTDAEEGLVYRANGKILTIKDLTNILSSKYVEQTLSNFREMYDGYINVESGKKGGTKGAKPHITVIMGVTPDAIDNSRIFKSELGERFIYTRFPKFEMEDEQLLVDAIVSGEFKDEKKREYINSKMNALLIDIYNRRKTYQGHNKNISINDREIINFLMRLSIFVAELRRGVVWDYREKEILDISTEEGPSRLYKQFMKITAAMKLVKGVDNIDDIVLNSIIKIGMDTANHKRFLCLLPFFIGYGKYEYFENARIIDYLKLEHNISKDRAKRTLQELDEINILEYNKKRSIEEDKDKIDIEKELNKNDSILKIANKTFGVDDKDVYKDNKLYWKLTNKFIIKYEDIIKKVKIIYDSEYVPKGLE